jgi:hypothetical protein
MVERALAAAIVGAAIVTVGASPARADRAATEEPCVAGLLPTTAVPPQRGRALELSVGTTGLVSGGTVEWQFTITNHTARPAGLLFLSAMFGDVKLHAAGRQAALDLFYRDGPAYRWSENRGFSQPLIWTVLPAQTAWRCSLPPSRLDVPEGRYLLVAFLNAALNGRMRPIAFRRYIDVSPMPTAVQPSGVPGEAGSHAPT